MDPLLLSPVVIAFSVTSSPPLWPPSTFLPSYLFYYVHTEADQIAFLLENLFDLWIWSLLFLVELCYQSSSRLVPTASSPTFPTSQHTCICICMHTCSRFWATIALYPTSEAALALCLLLSMPDLLAYFCIRLLEQDKTSAELFFLPGRMNCSYPTSTSSSCL